MNLDHRLTHWLRKQGRSFLPFWKIVAARGMWFFVPVWIGVAVAGWMEWWRPVVPLVLSYMTLLCVQAIVKRERPNFEQLSGYRMWIRTYSFPSGHATESAVLAGALLLYPAYPSVASFILLGSFLAGLALFVMYARVAVGVHYVTDILAGCALGILYVLGFFL